MAKVCDGRKYYEHSHRLYANALVLMTLRRSYNDAFRDLISGWKRGMMSSDLIHSLNFACSPVYSYLNTLKFTGSVVYSNLLGMSYLVCSLHFLEQDECFPGISALFEDCVDGVTRRIEDQSPDYRDLKG